MGPQADLVDHHRSHRDGVPATAGPFRVELFAGFGDLVELETEQPTVFIDAGQQQLAGGGGDGRFVNQGHYVLGYSITVAGLM